MKRYIVAKVLAAILMAAFATSAIAAESRSDGDSAKPAWIDGGGSGGGLSGAGVGNY